MGAPIDVAALVAQLRQDVRGAADAAPGAWTLAIESAPGLLGDEAPDPFGVPNLVDNAAKYTPPERPRRASAGGTTGRAAIFRSAIPASASPPSTSRA